MSQPRYAIVITKSTSVEQIERYLPGNYVVAASEEIVDQETGFPAVVIGGYDSAGWTLDDYVLPRLASGLIFGREISIERAHVLGAIDPGKDRV